MDGEETSFPERWLKGDHLASRGWCWQPLGPSRDAHLLPPPPIMVLIPPMVLPPGCSPWCSTALQHRPPAWGWWFFWGGLGKSEEPGQCLAVQFVGKGREKSV